MVKKTLLFSILLLTISSIARSQSIRQDGVPCYFVKPERGIPYRSQKLFYNINEILDFHFPDECENKVFYINGLPLSEKDFISLKIRKKEVDLNQCYYTLDYCGDSVIRINYYTTLIIPIMVNGKGYVVGDTLPKGVCGEQIISIKKDRRVFNENRIEIQIK